MSRLFEHIRPGFTIAFHTQVADWPHDTDEHGLPTFMRKVTLEPVVPLALIRYHCEECGKPLRFDQAYGQSMAWVVCKDCNEMLYG